MRRWSDFSGLIVTALDDLIVRRRHDYLEWPVGTQSDCVFWSVSQLHALTNSGRFNRYSFHRYLPAGKIVYYWANTLFHIRSPFFSWYMVTSAYNEFGRQLVSLVQFCIAEWCIWSHIPRAQLLAWTSTSKRDCRDQPICFHSYINHCEETRCFPSDSATMIKRTKVSIRILQFSTFISR